MRKEGMDFFNFDKAFISFAISMFNDKMKIPKGTNEQTFTNFNNNEVLWNSASHCANKRL